MVILEQFEIAIFPRYYSGGFYKFLTGSVGYIVLWKQEMSGMHPSCMCVLQICIYMLMQLLSSVSCSDSVGGCTAAHLQEFKRVSSNSGVCVLNYEGYIVLVIIL